MNNKLYDAKEIKWNQWLAGIIDGDGYLAIQKSNNVAVCEITMPLEDESLLFEIKQKLGGNIKLRAGCRAVRYRLNHKIGMIELICRVNGFIRNTIRVSQFQKICIHFNIVYLKPQPLTINDGYIAGFFDADGTICINIIKNSQKDSILSGIDGKIQRLANSRGYNQLQIFISNKYLENLLIFQQAFGFGKITAVKKKPYETHIYTINAPNINQFIQYTKKYPLRSTKKYRVLALPMYFKLINSKAHLAPESSLKRKAWLMFCKKWYHYQTKG